MEIMARNTIFMCIYDGGVLGIDWCSKVVRRPKTTFRCQRQLCTIWDCSSSM